MLNERAHIREFLVKKVIRLGRTPNPGVSNHHSQSRFVSSVGNIFVLFYTCYQQPSSRKQLFAVRKQEPEFG